MATQTGSIDLKGIASAYSDQQQYFWVESNSSATWGGGAHITNVAESAFKTAAGTWGTNTTAGGYNLLMNTDTVSGTGSLQLRNGALPIMNLDNDSLDFNVIDTTTTPYSTITVASFGANKAIIGKEDEIHAEVNAYGFEVRNPDPDGDDETLYMRKASGGGMEVCGSHGLSLSGGGVEPYNFIEFDDRMLSQGIPMDGLVTKHLGSGNNPQWYWDIFAPHERNYRQYTIDDEYTVRGSVRYDSTITLTTNGGNGWYRNTDAYYVSIPTKLQKANLYHGGFYGELPHHFVLTSCHISVMSGGLAYFYATPASWTSTQVKFYVAHLGAVSTRNAIIMIDFTGYYELDDDAIEPE